MSTLTLRKVDGARHARAQAVLRWQQAGHEAGLGRPGEGDCLTFRAVTETGHWHGLVMAGDWLHRSLPQLRSLLTADCPATSIARLFRTLTRPLLLELDELRYRAVSDVELITARSIPRQDMPWLDTARGRVWLAQLPPARRAPFTWAPGSWLSDLPLRVDLRLGISYLNRPLRQPLGEGDVLRITHRAFQCLSANRCIGVFTFTQEGLHMQSTVADESLPGPDEPTQEMALGELPVRLEFVLATHDIDLCSLSRFIAGQLIPLADDAARGIEVRANGKCVARGELVQLDGQLAVELLEVYRNSRDE